MSDLSWAATVRLVYERAKGCCEYCQTCEKVTGQAMHVEHIDPQGDDHPDNLCLSCPSCNLSKAQAIAAVDSQTMESVSLFNPRKQLWSDHFEWVDNIERLVGRTPIGRATVERFKMNRDRIVIARRIWIKAGEHPPML
jgi:hypothetical protein